MTFSAYGALSTLSPANYISWNGPTQNRWATAVTGLTITLSLQPATLLSSAATMTSGSWWGLRRLARSAHNDGELTSLPHKVTGHPEEHHTFTFTAGKATVTSMDSSESVSTLAFAGCSATSACSSAPRPVESLQAVIIISARWPTDQLRLQVVDALASR